MTNQDRIQRKRIRLDRDLYMDPDRIASITLSTLDRHPLFTDSELTHEFIRALQTSSETYDATVLVYCFMPDHAHLLIRNGETTDLVKFINGYKSWTTRIAWRHGHQGRVWQRSFYDHLLRKDEDLNRHLRYIIENPVRAGLAATWVDYPFTGSFEFDFTDFDV